MLPAQHRMRAAEDFSAAVRKGVRAGRTNVVGHLLVASGEEDSGALAPARLGFVVSRAVGGAVVRNRVRRRLRHLLRDRLVEVPAGGLLVFRALPPAAHASWSDLGGDVDGILRKLVAKATRGGRS